MDSQIPQWQKKAAMTLGDILAEVAKKDMAGGHKFDLLYEEKVEGGKFRIRLISDTDRDAYIHCSVPYDLVLPEEELEGKKNYARAYFLSMLFNSAIRQMKREKSDNKKKLPPTS
jgi:hypothetical protein